jgi:hypothetical protein
MNELRDIARSRSESDMNTRLAALAADVQVLQRQLSASGQLRSGNMLRGVLKIAQESLRSHAVVLSENYSWAVNEAIAASQSWVRRLAAEASDSMRPLFVAGSEQLTDACKLADQPQLATRLIADLETTHFESREAILVALDAKFASKSRGMLKWVGSLFGLLKGSSGK